MAGFINFYSDSGQVGNILKNPLDWAVIRPYNMPQASQKGAALKEYDTMKYINFFPGNARESREVVINDNACYGMDDVVGLVDSMIQGIASSAPVDGACAAIEDGATWVDLCAVHGDQVVQDTLEELHSIFTPEQIADAYKHRAWLTGAEDLSGANLLGANLLGADLSGAWPKHED